MILLTVAAYLVMTAVEVPALWGRRQARGELWAVGVLLVTGLALAIVTVLGYRAVSLWKVVEAVFKPIGTLLFSTERS